MDSSMQIDRFYTRSPVKPLENCQCIDDQAPDDEALPQGLKQRSVKRKPFSPGSLLHKQS